MLLYRSCTVATVDREFTIYFLGIYFGLDLDSAVFVGSADQPVDADHHDDHEHAHQHHVQQVHLRIVYSTVQYSTVHLPTATVGVGIIMVLR